MAKIEIKESGRKLFCRKGENLLNVLNGEGIMLESPCSGKGICGKCKIQIVSGSQIPLSDEEKRLLRPEEIEKGMHLACMVEVKDNIVVAIPRREEIETVLERGYIPDFQKDHFGDGYGIAVDLGTTTIALSLFGLSSGRECGKTSGVNDQRKYGADVLTRIDYEREHGENGIQCLQKVMIRQLNEMIREVCENVNIPIKQIKKMTVSANCVMTHMLLGRDARSLGKAPFHTEFTNAVRARTEDVGLNAGEGAELYCLPQVSGYIGGDIVAGVYACGMLKKKRQKVLFIDIGTNGEIVLSGNGRCVSCSCAAGPALEGMNISFGMQAAKGAVDEVKITEEGVQLSVIGGGTPKGICGSGILAAVRELVRTKMIKPNGAFVKPEEMEEKDYRQPMIRMNGKKREFILSQDPMITVTQNDVRQIQLAKGAIRSGIEVLLKETGIGEEELDQVIIAGQFGTFLSEKSLVDTGILPEAVRGKICYMGNTSKSGACMMLLSEKCRKEAEELTSQIEYVELAKAADYERIFAESLKFPE